MEKWASVFVHKIIQHSLMFANKAAADDSGVHLAFSQGLDVAVKAF